jgi:deoxyribodipyrimidine photo-lyase
MGAAYAAGRNHDAGPGAHGAVSGLSPWVRHRLVTEAELIAAAEAAHGAGGAAKFVQEVLWRSYWKGWIEQRPSVWHDYKAAVARGLADSAGEVAAVAAGRTGIACMDHWASELVNTGTLHNHALATRGRSVPASFARCRCGLQHAFLAVGRGPAHAGQALHRTGRKYRPLHGRPF